jgi:transposase-like protein
MTTATVLSGPERRRRWTSAEKARIVEESLAPEANVTEVARRHDVHPNLLHAWRRQARTGTVVAGRDSEMARDGGCRFVPVAVASDGGVARATRSDAGADGEKPKPPTAPIREGASLHNYAVRLGLKVQQRPGAAFMLVGCGRPTDAGARLSRSKRRGK